MFLPESPRYLLKKGKEAAGKSALGRLLTQPSDSPEVAAEFDEIMAALEADRKIGSGSYLGMVILFYLTQASLTSR